MFQSFHPQRKVKTPNAQEPVRILRMRSDDVSWSMVQLGQTPKVKNESKISLFMTRIKPEPLYPQPNMLLITYYESLRVTN
jgi:hypothetical protein